MKRMSPEERKKIDMCRQFLVNRGYIVYQKLVTSAMLADMLGVSAAHIANLYKEGDFPKPYNLVAGGPWQGKRATQRFDITEVIKWLETRREEEAA